MQAIKSQQWEDLDEQGKNIKYKVEDKQEVAMTVAFIEHVYIERAQGGVQCARCGRWARTARVTWTRYHFYGREEYFRVIVFHSMSFLPDDYPSKRHRGLKKAGT